jgi:heme-degrading monooxygenase HmoA
VILTVFRSRLHPEAVERGYLELADEMERRAREMPGFVDFKSFIADDGERVSVVEFDTIENHERWREDPVHRTAQQRGRADYYAEYQVTVGEVLRKYSFGLP